MNRVLVTGATGFVGRAVCGRLLEEGWRVRAAVRRVGAALPSDVEATAVGDVAQARWEAALDGVAAVVHLAAAVHGVRAERDEAAYDTVNHVATERLAAAAARAGARRFVFMSTIKVNGESTPLDRPFRAADAPRPQDSYARSKWRAEQALAVGQRSGLEVVVIRPPLVYGAGVKANFRRLVRLVDTRLPLPFASIRNRRSLIYVGNLAALVGRCLTHPQAASQTFLASDGEDLSTPELVRRIGAARGFTPRLLPFPPALLPRRLAGSLAVDDVDTRELLDWRPPFTLDEGLARSVARHGS